MADSDGQLIEDLRSFGEIVDKITDKNRLIMEKKLNHLRARRRMSEKLSQSMLNAKSPVKASKGRGKKNNKKVGLSQTQVINIDQLPLRSDTTFDKSDEPPVKKFVESVESNKSSIVAVASEVVSDEAQLQSVKSKALPTKRGRKSAMPSAAVIKSDVRSQDDNVKPSGNESTASKGDVSVVTMVVSAGDKSKRGKKTVSSSQNETKKTLVNEHQSDHASQTMNVDHSTKRRTYSIDKLDLDVDAKVASRIPKLARGKSTVQDIRGTCESAVDPVGVTRPQVGQNTTPASKQRSHPVPTYSTNIAKQGAGVNIHIIDSTIGGAASNVAVSLHRQTDQCSWNHIASGSTGDDGHCSNLGSGNVVQNETYRLHVDSQQYFQRTCRRCFYPFIDIVFNPSDISSHVAIQLTLSQFGFSMHKTV